MSKFGPCQTPDCEQASEVRGHCRKHYSHERNAGRLNPLTPLERFMAKTERSGDCLLWTATMLPDGYGRFKVARRNWLAHRWIWTHFNGPIPGDLTVDHMCNTPGCVRIDHLQLLSIYDNVMRGSSPYAVNRRKTHCIRGHEFTPANTMKAAPDGSGRKCRTCKRDYERAYVRGRGKAAAA